MSKIVNPRLNLTRIVLCLSKFSRGAFLSLLVTGFSGHCFAQGAVLKTLAHLINSADSAALPKAAAKLVGTNLNSGARAELANGLKNAVRVVTRRDRFGSAQELIDALGAAGLSRGGISSLETGIEDLNPAQLRSLTDEVTRLASANLQLDPSEPTAHFMFFVLRSPRSVGLKSQGLTQLVTTLGDSYKSRSEMMMAMGRFAIRTKARELGAKRIRDGVEAMNLSFPQLRSFTVGMAKWSDGTTAERALGDALHSYFFYTCSPISTLEHMYQIDRFLYAPLYGLLDANLAKSDLVELSGIFS